VCIFAYGQTGSGKTYTMSGAGPDSEGITPRAMRELFDAKARDSHKLDIKVSCYMMELYRDRLVDLFYSKKGREEDRPKLVVKKDPKGIVYVQGAEVREAQTRESLQAHMDFGLTQRHTGSTKMNAESSRSHLVFSILLQVENLKSHKSVVGKLTLVDLAGCERVGKTGASGELLKEAQSINKSLTALGDVISCLSGGKGGKHVPYRNSLLTQLMSDSLGGNAKTLMFVNISPADYNVEETQNALTYASRVKLIKNKSEQDVETKQIKKYKQMIKQLQEGIMPRELEIGGSSGDQDVDDSAQVDG